VFKYFPITFIASMHQSTASSGSSSAAQPTAGAVSGAVEDQVDRRSSANVSLTTPFRRSQFVSLSWSEKRGRRGRTTRRGRRRLSDPDLDAVLDTADLRHTALSVKPPTIFCRSDWKRQVNRVLHENINDKPVRVWISAPRPNVVAMATTVGPTTFCLVPLNRTSPKTP